MLAPLPTEQKAYLPQRLKMSDEGFLIPATLDAKGCFHSSVLPGFWINPAWLGQTPLPNEQITLDESLKNSFQTLHQALTRFQKNQS